jgi:acetolactate synthase I/II/III large subunit
LGAGGIVAEPLPIPAPPPIDPFAVENAARVLRDGKNVLILLAGRGVLAKSQKLAWRVARATGATILIDYVNGRVARGRGNLQLERVPFNTDLAIKMLSQFDHVILVNSKPPVGFFAYPDKPSTQYPSHAQLHFLSRLDQDADAALEALVDVLGAPQAAIPDPGPRPDPASGAPTPEGLAQTLAALMPENSIVSDESISYGRGFYRHTHTAPAHDWLQLTGGAIGDGLPVATGAAMGARGERRVISLQADGSAMYSLQSLWTQARERLPITTILLNNSKYNILIDEYANVGAIPGETAMSMLDLGNPDLSWVKIANGLGVEAARATTMEQCADLMSQSFRKSGPFVIELMI